MCWQKNDCMFFLYVFDCIEGQVIVGGFFFGGWCVGVVDMFDGFRNDQNLFVGYGVFFCGWFEYLSLEKLQYDGGNN